MARRPPTSETPDPPLLEKTKLGTENLPTGSKAPHIAVSPKKVLLQDLRGTAQVEGKVVSLSPIKRKQADGAIYFDGLLADDKQHLRFVGFSEKMHDDVSHFHQTKETILMSNYNIYQRNNNSEPQIYINDGRTTLQRSDTNFDIKPLVTTITLDELPLLPRYS